MIVMIIARFRMLIEQFLNLFCCRSVRAFQKVAVYVGCGAGSCVACSACDRHQRKEPTPQTKRSGIGFASSA